MADAPKDRVSIQVAAREIRRGDRDDRDGSDSAAERERVDPRTRVARSEVDLERSSAVAVLQMLAAEVLRRARHAELRGEVALLKRPRHGG
jgi:hypothetical protein